MEVGARRWTLRHESRVYGPQQARKLLNARKREEGTRSAHALHELLLSEKRRANKGWVIRVPAATVGKTAVSGNTRAPSGGRDYWA
jgi:hypothetical protein